MTFTSPKPLIRHLRLAVVVGAAVALPLAACSPTPAPHYPPPWLAAGCIDSTDPVQFDVLYNGTENALNNSAAVGTVSPLVGSTNGTCAGPDVLATLTVVRAANEPAAIAVCTGLDPLLTGAVSLVSLAYAAPTDAWGCYVA